MRLSYIYTAFPAFYLWREINNLIQLVGRLNGTTSENATQLISAQSIIVLGGLLLTLVFVLMAVNVSRRQIFVKKNHQIMDWFGSIIFVCGVISTHILTHNKLDDIVQLPITLHITGATLLFISYIFKKGIRLQREQDLTI